MRKPRITHLDVWANDERIGTLEKGAMYRFTYDNPGSPLLGLHYQDRGKVYISNNMPHIFAQYFPEGFLDAHITSKYAFHDAPFEDNEMLRLAILGRETLGRIHVRCNDPLFNEWIDGLEMKNPRILTERDLLGINARQVFQQYMAEIFHHGRFVSVSGIQQKMSLDAISRNTKQTASYIAKGFDASEYPCLATNEFLCMQTIKQAGIAVAQTSLSEDSSVLLVRRFDVSEQGYFLGMEDFTSLRQYSAEDKYKGSYAAIAQIIRQISGRPDEDLIHFFNQFAASCILKNGDAHLKNFSVLYHDEYDVRLAPAYDVLDTSIYRVGTQGIFDAYDDTLALNLTNHGKKTYPSKNTLLDFAEKYCDLGREDASFMIDTIVQAKEQVLVKYSDVLRENEWLAQKWHFIPDENEEGLPFTFR
ncbi:type II toxin-antitoxin system HipA family toxin [Neisseria meningitidis]|nr:hypothetical protein NMEN93004_1161 [Neisseria meningitidis 93004]EJU65645.1 hypothetical protein NMEN98008_1712 [Neisseria meningitidis 98008]MBG8585406.1 type II toxin-antitoxin system HipA family toxin [Neisseria meningitidis]MBG8587549.1 type II toxin-antitoxin system HipA family toxin [Neisseria meningitidis]MBG8592307.1 type II toxin-antitoxin system HipA family toxin [Neisseria meningitidis]